jgi:hypothetical protein
MLNSNIQSGMCYSAKLIVADLPMPAVTRTVVGEELDGVQSEQRLRVSLSVGVEMVCVAEAQCLLDY